MTISDTPPPPPRPITAHVRYRALAAKPVSILLLACSIIVVACAYTARGHFHEWSRINRLKDVGQSTQAVVTEIALRRPRGQRGAAREYAIFQFTPAGDSQTEPVVNQQRLHSLFDKPLKSGSQITVTYDPADPENFFCPATDDRSLANQLSVQIVFLIIAALLMLLAVLRYFALLIVVRNAPAHSGTVAEIRSSAQGAFSRLVVLTLQIEDSPLIIKRVVPMRLAHRFCVGDSIWLLTPPAKPSRAIIAADFL